MPINFLNDFIPTSLISTLSNLIFPLEGSKNLGIKSAIVDFPDPLAPTNATTDPFFIEKLTSSKT